MTRTRFAGLVVLLGLVPPTLEQPTVTGRNVAFSRDTVVR